MSESTDTPIRKRVLSGIQPTGELHLGNYLGAVRQWVAMQEEYDCFFCVVDYHALTGDTPAEVLPTQVVDMAVNLLAAGLDPDKCTIFVQSDVPEVTELQWLFNTVTPVGDLERMTQYKEKSARVESIPAGLLNYPILQAADILIYRADAVPVGDDQRQHLELTREIVRKWNAKYGEYFVEPAAIVPKVGRIKGLDGDAKMSKSLGNTVGMLADSDGIWDRVRTAVTDPQRVRRDDPGRPEVCNVFALHQEATDPNLIDDIASQCRAGTRGCVDCKRILADSLSHLFAPARERAAELRSNPDRVRAVLQAGADRARSEARETLDEVRQRMGLEWTGAL